MFDRHFWGDVDKRCLEEKEGKRKWDELAEVSQLLIFPILVVLIIR